MGEACSGDALSNGLEVHADPSKTELQQRWHPNCTSEGPARERRAAAMSRQVVLRDSCRS